MAANGKPARVRQRPYYASRDKAEADKERIQEQYSETGGGSFLFNRQAAGEFEQAKKIVGDLSLVEVAKFWRLHHPDKPVEKLGVLYEAFMADLEVRLGRKRTYSDRKSRLTALLAAGFRDRYPDSPKSVTSHAGLAGESSGTGQSRRRLAYRLG